MENIISLIDNKEKVKIFILNILAITFIYFVPAISHLLSFPIYLIEPLRVMLILSVAHTKKENAYFLALTLPIFSFLVSGHPLFPKMIIIITELVLNVWLFHYFNKKAGNPFFSMLISIVASKIYYYILQYIFIRTALLSSDIGEHSLYIQAIITIIFSGYVYLILKRKNA